MENEKMRFDNSGQRELKEQFDDACDEILKDVFDLNKDPRKTREITINIKIKADKELFWKMEKKWKK